MRDKRGKRGKSGSRACKFVRPKRTKRTKRTKFLRKVATPRMIRRDPGLKGETWAARRGLE